VRAHLDTSNTLLTPAAQFRKPADGRLKPRRESAKPACAGWDSDAFVAGG